MKIKRTINGIEMEFELTTNEMRDAYHEQQHKYDVEDVECVFYGMDVAEISDIYDTSWANIEPLIPEMARRYREYMDEYSDDWIYKINEAIADVLAEHREEM